jgi:bifunctional enzyme CysN/CysC
MDTCETAADERDRMDIVIVGHVDHGKSTVIGRLLADTHALPDGKLEQVRRTCEANAKPFEYAFLLDALRDEQAQGITIDAARCFFKSESRDYIIIDAPGHVEFLKNMVSGASRAEAALLVIDAKEGIAENSRRHGYLLSLLGVRQIVVLVNKMDLVGFSEDRFRAIERDFSAFLADLKVVPIAFVPVAAFLGDNLAVPSQQMPWFRGGTVLSVMDALAKIAPEERAFRMPVQDIYKFTEDGDDRRIVAGTVVAGFASVGDEVVFCPSGKTSRIRSIESFPATSQTQIAVGQAVGVTLETQVYLRPGEVMCKLNDPLPEVGTWFQASLFWLGRNPLVPKKRYKLKIGNASTSVYLREVKHAMNASDLTIAHGQRQIERHEVADCVFETVRPIAFDPAEISTETSRFVLVDGYEIAGGGIITKGLGTTGDAPSASWVTGSVAANERRSRFGQAPQLVLLTGPQMEPIHQFACALERALFDEGRLVYYLGFSNLRAGLASDVEFATAGRDEELRRLGEVARMFSDAGCIVITAIADIDESEATTLRSLAGAQGCVLVGLEAPGEPNLFAPAFPERASFFAAILPNDTEQKNVARLRSVLVERAMIFDYQI